MTDRAKRSWFPGSLALIGGGAIVAGSLLTWLKVGGGVSVETVSVKGTPKGTELTLGQVAFGAGAAVILLGLLLLAIRRARRLLGLLVIVGGLAAIAAAYFVASSPRDRYIDFAVQQGALPGQSDEVRASLANLFKVSGQEVDLGLGPYVVIGGGALSVMGGLTAVFGRRKTKPVEEAEELPEPDRLAKEWLAAREKEAAARSAAFEETPKPELVTQPAEPPPATEPKEPELVTQPVGPPPMPEPPEPELVTQPAGPPPPTEPPEPELVTQPAGPLPPAERPKPDARAARTKPLPAEWAAKAPTKRRRRRRS
jgi:hypothetical protein